MATDAKVTFIHAADLHIGAPFTGIRHTTPELAHSLVAAITQSYNRLIDTALRRQVDFVVFAGDVFDRARPTYADFSSFYNGLNKLQTAHIPVYICNGNHDPWSTWSKDYGELPDNTHIFSAEHPEFFVYRKGNSPDGTPLVTLGGRSFLNETFPKNDCIANGITKFDAQRATRIATPFYVGVIHTGLDFDHNQAYVPRQKLFSSGMNYWALGHIHKRMVINAPDGQNMQLAYSGCIQGRDVKEIGPRGCELVTLEQGKPNKLEFIPLSSIIWEQCNVDISECSTLDQATSKIRHALQRIDAGPGEHKVVVRVALVGRTNLNTLFSNENLNAIRHNINEHHAIVFCDSIIDCTRGIRDDATIKREGLFASLVLEGASWQKDHSNELFESLEREFAQRGEQLPCEFSDQMQSVEQDALELVFRELGGEKK